MAKRERDEEEQKRQTAEQKEQQERKAEKDESSGDDVQFVPPVKDYTKRGKREREDETGDQSPRKADDRKRQKIENKELKESSSEDDDVQFVPPRDDNNKKTSPKCDSPTLSPDSHRAESYESTVPLYNVKKGLPRGLLPLPPGLKIEHSSRPAIEHLPQPVGPRRMRDLPLQEVVQLATGRHAEVKTTFDIVYVQLESYLLEEPEEGSPKKPQGPPHFMIGVWRYGDEPHEFATATLCTWERHAFDNFSVLDRATITGIDIKPNQIIRAAKDITYKRGQKIERVNRTGTVTPWTIEALFKLQRDYLPRSRRLGRFTLVKAAIYAVAKQRAGVDYKEVVLQSDHDGRSAFGRFYGTFADAAAGFADGTVIILVQPEVSMEGDEGKETVVITLDDKFDPPCAIATESK